MRLYESEEVTRECLARLTRPTADATRSWRTRQRCRALLGQQRQGRVRARPRVASAGRVVRPLMVGAFFTFCAVYISALVATAWLLEAPFG